MADDKNEIMALTEQLYGIFSGKPEDRPSQLQVDNWAFQFYGHPFRPADRTFVVLIGDVEGNPIVSERLISYVKSKKVAATATVTYTLKQVDPYFDLYLQSKGLTLEKFEGIIK